MIWFLVKIPVTPLAPGVTTKPQSTWSTPSTPIPGIGSSSGPTSTPIVKTSDLSTTSTTRGKHYESNITNNLSGFV